MVRSAQRTRFRYKIRDNYLGRYYWRKLEETDKFEICSWIKSKNALKLVSGNRGNKLTEEILNSWIQKSLLCFVAVGSEGAKLHGFMTLSAEEAAGLPLTAIELCHLIVKPCRESYWVAAYLCEIAKSAAKQLGFSVLLGRVVPWNDFGLFLARSQGFKRILSRGRWSSNNFIWHYIPLVDFHLKNKEDRDKNENAQFQTQNY